MNRKLLFNTILSALLLFCCRAESKNLEIYSVTYGNSDFDRRFIDYGYKGKDRVKFAWKFYFIKFNGKNILIDTGFRDAKLLKMFSIRDYMDPVEILQKNGIKPESIDYVFLTHSHFDHAGNCNRFRNAKFIMSEKAYTNLKKNWSMRDVYNFMKKDVNTILFKDSLKFMDIFTLKLIGGHTSGSAVIYLDYGKNRFCFTGDEVYLEKNILQSMGSGSVTSHSKNKKFIESIKNSEYKPLIFHEPDTETHENRIKQIKISE